ncbi:hypothetical protein CSQ85_05780 [Bifidobacterium rousetti]|nr:hypothetical protein CSQ85_05780 [Bifidobacterium rousetti]
MEDGRDTSRNGQRQTGQNQWELDKDKTNQDRVAGPVGSWLGHGWVMAGSCEYAYRDQQQGNPVLRTLRSTQHTRNGA